MFLLASFGERRPFNSVTQVCVTFIYKALGMPRISAALVAMGALVLIEAVLIREKPIIHGFNGLG